MKTNRPKTWWLRTSQGARQAKKIREATAIPRSEGKFFLDRRYHAHSPLAGRKERSDGFTSAVIPQSTPNIAQPFNPGQSSSSSVTRKMSANKKGEIVVSH